jgi:hypothetical protein
MATMENQKNPNETQAALDAAFPQNADRRVLLTVKQFPLRNPAFTEASLRNLIFKADDRLSSKGVIKGNGLIACGALIRVGRKVMIDEAKFFAWIDAFGKVA